MDKHNQVIDNIPVRKGLEEMYCVHINVASVTWTHKAMYSNELNKQCQCKHSLASFLKALCCITAILPCVPFSEQTTLGHSGGDQKELE